MATGQTRNAATCRFAADGTLNTESSYNVSAVVKTATGRYTVTLVDPLDENECDPSAATTGAFSADGTAPDIASIRFASPTSIQIRTTRGTADTDNACSMTITQRRNAG